MEAVSLPPIRRILWAVDAFEMDAEIQRHCVETLRELSRKTSAEIEPVYVFTPGELNLSVDFTVSALEQYKISAEKALVEGLEKVDLPGLMAPRVLIDSKHPSSHAEHILAMHAENTGAGFIVAGTHGRSGLKRLFLGSFTDSLVHRSRVPVLVQGRNGPLTSALDHFIFATDLSMRSRALFKYVVAMARDWGARITIFNSAPNPIDPIVQSGLYLFGGSWVPMRHIFEQEDSRRDRRLAAWSDWAAKQGVPCRSVVDDQSGQISESILALASSEGAGLIVAAPHSGAITAALTGSITRQVIHHAVCPVLAFPPGFEPRLVRASKTANPRAA